MKRDFYTNLSNCGIVTYYNGGMFFTIQKIKKQMKAFAFWFGRTERRNRIVIVFFVVWYIIDVEWWCWVCVWSDLCCFLVPPIAFFSSFFFSQSHFLCLPSPGMVSNCNIQRGKFLILLNLLFTHSWLPSSLVSVCVCVYSFFFCSFFVPLGWMYFSSLRRNSINAFCFCVSMFAVFFSYNNLFEFSVSTLRGGSCNFWTNDTFFGTERDLEFLVANHSLTYSFLSCTAPIQQRFLSDREKKTWNIPFLCIIVQCTL